MINDAEPIAIPFSKIPKLYFLSKTQIQTVISQSLHLVRVKDQVKLAIDIERVRDIVRNMNPKNIRDEYYRANINIKLVQIIQGTTLELDSFSVQIRMPCIEVLSEVTEGVSLKEQSQNELHKRAIFRTTVAHFVTGR